MTAFEPDPGSDVEARYRQLPPMFAEMCIVDVPCGNCAGSGRVLARVGRTPDLLRNLAGFRACCVCDVNPIYATAWRYSR